MTVWKDGKHENKHIENNYTCHRFIYERRGTWGGIPPQPPISHLVTFKLFETLIPHVLCPPLQALKPTSIYLCLLSNIIPRLVLGRFPLLPLFAFGSIFVIRLLLVLVPLPTSAFVLRLVPGEGLVQPPQVEAAAAAEADVLGVVVVRSL